MRKIDFKVVLGLVATILLLSACGKGSGLYGNSGQTYQIAVLSDINTLDTVLATDTVSFTIYNQVFEGLYILSGKDEVIPGITKGDPKESSDGKTLTVKLRKNVKWSNGDPVTTRDFVFAWRKAVDSKTASEYTYAMYDIKNAEDINLGRHGKKPKDSGIKALDDHTLRIDLTKPIPYFRQMLAFSTFMPQNEKAVKKYGGKYRTTTEKVIYNGPFRVSKWAVEDKIVLTKNDSYWDRKSVKLDRVNYRVLKDAQTGASLYDTNSIDSAGITSEQADKYKDNPGLFKRLIASTFLLKMNKKQQPEFENKNMRLTIVQSINKRGYVNEILGAGAKPFDGFATRDTVKTSEGKDYANAVRSPLESNPKEVRQHPSKAKKALGEDKFTFTLNTEDTPDSRISAEFIKSQVGSSLPGVTVKTRQLPFKQRVETELSMNYSMSLSG